MGGHDGPARLHTPTKINTSNFYSCGPVMFQPLPACKTREGAHGTEYRGGCTGTGSAVRHSAGLCALAWAILDLGLRMVCPSSSTAYSHGCEAAHWASARSVS